MGTDKIQIENKSRPWADLPRDILRIIKNKLPCLSDKVSFDSVCKNWGTPGAKLPWVMTYYHNYTRWRSRSTDESFECQLFHPQDPTRFTSATVLIKNEISSAAIRDITPIYSPTCPVYSPTSPGYCPISHGYPIYCLTSPGLYPPTGRCICHDGRCPKVCASKQGWLLIVTADYLGSAKKSIFTFFNAFLDLVISVPKFAYDVELATFSTIPTSPRCVIFVLYCCSLGKTRVGTYKIGDVYWNTQVIAERKDDPQAKSILYVNELLYYIFQDGMLGCYSFEKNRSIILTEHFPRHFSVSSVYHFHLFGCDGEVRLATASKNCDEWCIFRFDHKENPMAWIAEKSLGGGAALFASPTSFVVRDLGDAADLAGCICYFDDETKEVKVFSLNDPPILKSPECKPLEDIRTMIKALKTLGSDGVTIWIQPPRPGSIRD
ncbi:uncharacterized protein [Coffea arabica]|uniref:KIB1-4 beta-propeller domain-containing protein n=1 Tax=Coffea arabica TaxID=13443 RepID=A0ABM4UQN1_COFAR